MRATRTLIAANSQELCLPSVRLPVPAHLGRPGLHAIHETSPMPCVDAARRICPPATARLAGGAVRQSPAARATQVEAGAAVDSSVVRRDGPQVSPRSQQQPAWSLLLDPYPMKRGQRCQTQELARQGDGGSACPPPGGPAMAPAPAARCLAQEAAIPGPVLRRPGQPEPRLLLWPWPGLSGGHRHQHKNE